MEGQDRKGGEYWAYPPPEKKGWDIPSPQTDCIVTPSGRVRQEDFRAGEAFPLAQASGLPAVPWADLGAWVCRGLF